jgi:tRNA A58 N-methylase Trm61
LKCDECKGTGKVDYIGRLEKFLSNVDERPKEKTLEELLKRGFINTEIEPIILKAIKIANEMTRPEMEYYKNVIISIANKRVTGRVIIGQLQALIDAMEEQRKINY